MVALTPFGRALVGFPPARLSVCGRSGGGYRRCGCRVIISAWLRSRLPSSARPIVTNTEYLGRRRGLDGLTVPLNVLRFSFISACRTTICSSRRSSSRSAYLVDDQQPDGKFYLRAIRDSERAAARLRRAGEPHQLYAFMLSAV